MYRVYLLNVLAILREREYGFTLFRILPALVQSTCVSLVRHSAHLTSQSERAVKQVIS